MFLATQIGVIRTCFMLDKVEIITIVYITLLGAIERKL